MHTYRAIIHTVNVIQEITHSYRENECYLLYSTHTYLCRALQNTQLSVIYKNCQKSPVLQLDKDLMNVRKREKILYFK